MHVRIAIVALSLLPLEVQGSKWLDYIRKYDMNDYSLGVAVSVVQNPYIGTENKTYAYPYLTSFEHPTLKDSWLVVRDGELGMRVITNSGWEFAALGRLQTMGFGNQESEELRGVEAPKWTVELGPSIGLRRWPIQLHVAAFFEPTNRHDGIASRIAVSYPVELAKGYIVPHVETHFEDSNYTDYYFGVSDAAATPERPAYVPGDAMNIELGIDWGYQIGERWLLSGKLGYEMLDAAIRNSPLVDRDSIWSVNLGLAYNADLFNTRAPGASNLDSNNLDIRFGVFNTSVDSKIGRDTVDGTPGDEIDLEDLLGESDNENVAQLDVVWRVAHYHRLEASYFELVRSSITTLPDELQFGANTYAADTEISSRSHFKSFRLGYAFSLMRDTQKELGVMAGVHFSSFDSIISTGQGEAPERSRLDVPLPVVGAHGSVNLGEKTVLAARLQAFRTDYDTYEGSLNYATLDIQRQIGTGFKAGLGYNYYRMKLQSSNNDLNGYVLIEHKGPTLFVTYRF